VPTTISPYDSSTNADIEADLMPTFAKSMRIIPRLEVAVVELGHALKHNTCFFCLHSFSKMIPPAVC
jgi:hypothetical protein